MNLKPCPYRHVGDEGHILCDKIKSGDREVTPNICRACPISQINCAHLRANLSHQAHPPVTVRWGNGKTEIWEDDAPSISFNQAACAEKVIPILAVKDCAGCTLRQALVSMEAIVQPAPIERRPQAPVARASRVASTARAPIASPVVHAEHVATAPVAQAQPAPDVRSNIVAQKIIQLQEWLTKQKNAPQKADEESVAPIQYASRPAPRAVGEEKRAGWTD